MIERAQSSSGTFVLLCLLTGAVSRGSSVAGGRQLTGPSFAGPSKIHRFAQGALRTARGVTAGPQGELEAGLRGHSTPSSPQVLWECQGRLSLTLRQAVSLWLRETCLRVLAPDKFRHQRQNKLPPHPFSSCLLLSLLPSPNILKKHHVSPPPVLPSLAKGGALWLAQFEPSSSSSPEHSEGRNSTHRLGRGG